MNQKQQVLLHCSLIDGIGPRAIINLLSSIEECCDDLYQWHASDFVVRCGMTPAQAELLYNGLSQMHILEQEVQLIAKHTVSYVTLLDHDYPALLKEIHLPPPILYFHGKLPDSARGIAVVGSRKANLYGHRQIHTLVPDLVKSGWVIVSGGAIGADTMAHTAALKSGGKTAVVIGSGLLEPYPKSNKRLFEQVIQKDGAIMSPFPLQAPAQAGNFPARNRVISGMSRGCVVVQAAQRSGASITASFALEQGREVFAVPGSIEDPLSVGCHRLIQQGAKLIQSVDDILVEFGQENKQEAIKEHNQSIELPHESHSSNALLEQKILAACNQPISLDDLVAALEITVPDLQEALFEMQLAGTVQQNFAGLWQKV